MSIKCPSSKQTKPFNKQRNEWTVVKKAAPVKFAQCCVNNEEVRCINIEDAYELESQCFDWIEETFIGQKIIVTIHVLENIILYRNQAKYVCIHGGNPNITSEEEMFIKNFKLMSMDNILCVNNIRLNKYNQVVSIAFTHKPVIKGGNYLIICLSTNFTMTTFVPHKNHDYV